MVVWDDRTTVHLEGGFRPLDPEHPPPPGPPPPPLRGVLVAQVLPTHLGYDERAALLARRDGPDVALLVQVALADSELRGVGLQA